MQHAIERAPARQQLRWWRDAVGPKEHGSWSLALEPLAFALIAAPSAAGGLLAAAAVAGFFARRPLRIAVADARPERRALARRAVAACAALALSGGLGALLAGAHGPAWLAWLLPPAVAGAAFLYFDLQQAGREQHAEVAGSFAFASMPAAFAALAGWPASSAGALAVVMLARAVPTVLAVRATLRARKTGEFPSALPVLAAIAAAAAVFALAGTGLAPWTAFWLSTVLALRAFALLVFPRPALRASTIGIAEAVFGAVYVIAVAVAWRL